MNSGFAVNIISVGVDFGTSNTVVAVVDDQLATHVLDIRSIAGVARTLPSILCFKPDEQHSRSIPHSSAGMDAIADYVGRGGPARLVQSMKSFLGTRSFVDARIFHHTFTLSDLIGTLLQHCFRAADAERFLDGKPLVIGRPIRFAGASPDDALAHARLLTAFEFATAKPTDVRLEPEGAAYAFARSAQGHHLILVADFGGGTSDFSVVELNANTSPPTIKPLAQSGVGIAGDRFDYGIVYHAICPALGLGSTFRPEHKDLPIPLWLYANFSSWHQLSMMNNRQTLRHIAEIMRSADDPAAFEGLAHVIRNDEGFSLFQVVSGVKQQLSSASSARLTFQAGPVNIDRRVTRAEFDTWIAEDLADIDAAAMSCIAAAGVRPDEITRVFMTGGSSLVPAVRALFANRFGADRLVGGDEFASVARGLALMGCGA